MEYNKVKWSQLRISFQEKVIIFEHESKCWELQNRIIYLFRSLNIDLNHLSSHYLIPGRFLAEMTNQVLLDLEASKYQVYEFYPFSWNPTFSWSPPIDALLTLFSWAGAHLVWLNHGVVARNLHWT